MSDSFSLAQEWLGELASEGAFFRVGELPSLGVVNLILDEFGRPDESFDFRVVVGGTAGKGGVCRSVETALESCGVRTACLVSPHLQVVTERVRVGGRLVSGEVFGDGVLRVREVAEYLGVLPTYYEAVVLVGILVARDAGAQVLICEVGMGGRFDAVNAVRGKRVAGLTFVGRDHLEFFENDWDVLALEKAGIFTDDSVLNVVGDLDTYEFLNKKCVQGLSFFGCSKFDLCCVMAGAIVERIVDSVLSENVDVGDLVSGGVALPARWEWVADDVVLEGAHCVDRFEFCLPALKKISGKRVGLFGMTKNHDPAAFGVVLPFFDEVLWTDVGLSPKDLNQRCEEFRSGAEPHSSSKVLKNEDGVGKPRPALSSGCSFSLTRRPSPLRETPSGSEDLNQRVLKRDFWNASELCEKFGVGEVVSDLDLAFEKARSFGGTVVVMGSFYLCGAVREGFYSSDEIFRQCSEFPVLGFEC